MRVPTNLEATPPTAQRRRVKMRRTQILEALDRLVSEGKMPQSLSDLGRAANLSPATTYRYFNSMDEVVRAYLVHVMSELRDYSDRQPEMGVALLHKISRFWIGMCDLHGPVLVQIRSRVGFYERIQNATESTVLGFVARRRALAGTLDELGLSAGLIEDAGMLYNMMFDPRDILDTMKSRDISPDALTTLMVDCFTGALRGWAGSGALPGNAGEGKG